MIAAPDLHGRPLAPDRGPAQEAQHGEPPPCRAARRSETRPRREALVAQAPGGDHLRDAAALRAGEEAARDQHDGGEAERGDEQRQQGGARHTGPQDRVGEVGRLREDDRRDPDGEPAQPEGDPLAPQRPRHPHPPRPAEAILQRPAPSGRPRLAHRPTSRAGQVLRARITRPRPSQPGVPRPAGRSDEPEVSLRTNGKAASASPRKARALASVSSSSTARWARRERRLMNANGRRSRGPPSLARSLGRCFTSVWATPSSCSLNVPVAFSGVTGAGRRTRPRPWGCGRPRPGSGTAGRVGPRARGRRAVGRSRGAGRIPRHAPPRSPSRAAGAAGWSGPGSRPRPARGRSRRRRRSRSAT